MAQPRSRPSPAPDPRGPRQARPGHARPRARTALGLLATASALVVGGATLAVTGAGTSAVPVSADSAAEVPVGSGSYTTTRPAGASGPSNLNGDPVSPKVTDDHTGPAPTNEWWSSLIFQRYPDNPHGENLFAHPLSFKPHSGGLDMGYPDSHRLVGGDLKYEYTAVTDLTLGAAGLNSPDTRTADSGDWTVTAHWEGGGAQLRVTIGQGLPFAYAETQGAAAEVTFESSPDIWHEDGSTVGATVNGRHYALFSPSDSPWTVSGDTLTADTGEDGYYSAAVLPSPEDLDTFAPYAHSHVTGSLVEYDYDESGATLTTDYQLQTQAKEGEETGTLTALYPHQWAHVSGDLTDLAYASPRGQMRVLEGSSFSTELTTRGIMPSLPTVDSADHDRMAALIDEVLAEEELFPEPGDTYWDGKAMGRLAQLIPVADSIGHTGARDELLSLVQGRLEDWLTAGGTRQFHHDAEWGTMLGYPDSFGAATELNDHDFHYGYFVSAAAVVARYDRDWADEDAWGGMIRLLIEDVAGTDPDSDMFPRLRAFSPYAGHGWASGHAGFAAGNNQESSSEGMHFAAATAHFGALTGDQELRDLGVYLHTTQASTVARYWQNADGNTFPEDYPEDVVGMVWGDGGDYRIWWDGGHEEHYGINYLPITAGSLYLGHDPEHAGAMYESLVAKLGGEPEIWRDIHWAHRALSDGGDALRMFEEQWDTYEPEAGGSKPHTYQWVSTLAEVGTVDASVTADTAHYAVFGNGTERAYTAFNPGESALTVTFSDGTTLQVQPGSVGSTVGEGGGGDPGNGDGPDPDPSPGPGEGNVGDGTLHLTETTISTSPGGPQGTLSVPGAGGQNHDGTPPSNSVVLEIEGLTGSFTGGSTSFALPVDSGTGVGNAVQVRVSFDFDGDGSHDREEIYRYFATDDLPGWETYTQAQGVSSSDGAFADLDGGSVRVEIWSALGSQDSEVRIGGQEGSVLGIPFTD